MTGMKDGRIAGLLLMGTEILKERHEVYKGCLEAAPSPIV